MTINQIVKHRKKNKPKRAPMSVSLKSNPQKRGVCLSVFVAKPKKPNSANRKVAKVKLSNGAIVNAYIPGEGHNIQEHSYVLVRGGKVQDLPGTKYKVIRGIYDVDAVSSRKRSRSKYGAKRNAEGN